MDGSFLGGNYNSSFYVESSKTVGTEDTVAVEEETKASRFMDCILKNLVKGVKAKEKLVRYRVCQLIAMILNEVQEMK